MVEKVSQREARKTTKTTFIDCDIHNTVPSVECSNRTFRSAGRGT